jgi:Ca2+-binding RTX toxin-like protein
MLAIIGLLGLAVSGTAFVGFPTLSGGSDTDPLGATDDAAPQTNDLETTDIGGFLDIDEDAERGLIDDLAVTDIADNTTDQEAFADLVRAETVDLYNEFFGNDGDDIAAGQSSHDYLDGRGGDDTLWGGDGDDHVHGGAGDDTVSGDGGDDLVYGYIGDDDMSGGTGDDKLHAGDGDDVINGGSGNDELLGGHGEDIAEKNYLNGSDGQETLIGNDGDVMSGGADADRFEITGGTVSIMDYADDDLLVLNYEGNVPELTTQSTADGTILLANGAPVASLYGVTAFDVGTVQLVQT